MKHILLILILLSAFYLCVADDMMQPVANHMKSVSIPPKNISAPQQDRAVYSFMIPPTNLLISYWDYMVGGLYSTAVRVQSPEAGNGVFVTYMGMRTASSQRRVFYSYLDNDGNIVINTEITETNLREGYPGQDIDRLSGKPIFAWHSNSDALDTQLEVNVALNWFYDGNPGPFGWSGLLINNPVPLTINNDVYTDNEFIWPVVEIGPSPTPSQRRVYIFTRNFTSHSIPQRPSENICYMYADFTPASLDSLSHLNWSQGSIPQLDNWNTDQTAWRRFFGSSVVGEDGNVYMIGYHTALNLNDYVILEPYLDVFVNTNYGEGEWTHYSTNPDIDVLCPLTDPPTTMKYSISSGSHNSAFVTPDGHLHYPLIFDFSIPEESIIFPLMSYTKDVDFNVNDHTFLIHDLYPTGVHPNDGNPVLPWDMNEDGVTDTTAAGDIALFPEWPYMYWDETNHSGNMIFDYNMVKYSKMNEQGMVAAVWSSSLNAKLYNENPEAYPELAPYMNVPEIFISVYPVPGVDGPQWSIPISLNSVNTPELHPPLNPPMIPEWVYPGDYIEYLGTTAEGYKVGKLHMMFYTDQNWGSWTMYPDDPGMVMYAAMKIAWSPGLPQAGDIIGVSDHTNPILTALVQNYPNPFNPTTTIEYNITKQGQASVTVYNVKGQKVRSLVNETKPVGSYKVIWDGTSDNGNKVGSGVYLYRFENSGKSIMKKMVMLK